MLRLQDLKGNTALSTEGGFGTLVDTLFDDQEWNLRYIIADIEESNIAKKRILLPPETISAVNNSNHTVKFALDFDTVKNSPNAAENIPISRQLEVALFDHYKLPYYWQKGEIPSHGAGDLTGVPLVEMNTELREQIEASENPEVNHLRSVNEMTGYAIHARDGQIGEIQDILVDESSWRILFLVVNTGNWLTGRKVLLSPTWIEKISWQEKLVQVDLARETIRNSPEYNPDEMLDDHYHTRLARYYHDIDKAD